ncbi:hypothetical protein Anacy_3201 [Anabaena cylindrica PCC 7122]|uniref:Uncharacterized protein n=1 Tax=Anabaena cylindrica (strain ATCC 27899 / PCC 7122) TaxID=272123 RepID=K9ZIM1_ANACC|nr:hypothetical protein Anacy_3201 [Anabaena cylindrica PCC 7122]BAY04384.1 hypothetical protein NIES19_36480 [Anabaena cylindrica PCC 7122]
MKSAKIYLLGVYRRGYLNSLRLYQHPPLKGEKNLLNILLFKHDLGKSKLLIQQIPLFKYPLRSQIQIHMSL